MILSSWGRLLLLLVMIWNYTHDMIHVVNLVVVSSNVVALHALLPPGVTTLSALMLTLVPFGARTLFQMLLSHYMGLPVVFSTQYSPW